MSIESIVNICLSFITIVVALVAVGFTCKQIHISNKQSLLEKRIKIYLIVSGLVELCNEHKGVLKDYDKPEYVNFRAVDENYFFMTNSAFLENIQSSIYHPLEGDWQRLYLLKREEMKGLSIKARIVFSMNLGSVFSEFIFSYQKMLESMYLYKVCLNSIDKELEYKETFPKNNHKKLSKEVL